ncbi:hypothetical protein EVAR_17299_1 [Eumeta japonica]|uniref:Uncharacterized protein n=1 Tax=Eumeta variegata TaxID=151549 RepID=A0A4C1TTF1_EUMVA|nr:hypothetical protein EVAR_17299_1 [Eumeta japonica]
MQWHSMPKLLARQYRSMPHRGTEDFLYDLLTCICNELNLKKIILMALLSIEGPFDSEWWSASNQLLAHECPVNFYGMVMDYLLDREVVDRYPESESRKASFKGCI